MTAAALAEYLILRPDQQDTILHNSRFTQPPIAAKYADAMRGLRTYNADRTRPRLAIEKVKQALTAKSKAANIRPSAREEALRCLELLEQFDRVENALGMKEFPLVMAPRFEPLDVEGVKVSVQPDFLIEALKGGGKSIGALMMRPQKAPDPSACRRDDTRERKGEHRREMARYMVAMLDMLLEAQASGRGEIDRKLMFVADIRLGERIGSGGDHSARVRAIKAGCRQIVALWATIEPRPSILRK